MNNLNIFFDNKIINENEINEGKIILKSKPLTLRIVITNLCNLQCIMCGISNQKNKFSIPYEKIIKVKEFLPYLERVDWQGGEVFLVDYFKELFQQLSTYKNIHQTIQTNGLLFDKKWIELLVKSNTTVLFSIDGVTKEIYEYIRKGASFKQLLENIALFNEFINKYNSKSEKVLCVCIMRSNYLQIKEFVDFAIKYDFKRISFGFIHGTHVPPEENIFNPIDNKAIEFLRWQMPLIEESCKKYNITLDCYFSSFLINKKSDPINAHPIQQNKKNGLICRLPWINLAIDAIRGGNVYPECLCSKSIGNIMDEDLIEIWNSEPMQEYRKKILEDRYQEICSKDCFRVV